MAMVSIKGDSMIRNIRDLLINDEGLRLERYLDTEGKPTIGVGHLLPPDSDVQTITYEECMQMLDDDICAHKIDLDVNLPWARALDDVRYAVLLNMAFNLGINRLLGFKKTLACCRVHDWEGMKREMLDSKWARQVKGRATRLAEMVVSGEWPK